MITSSQLYDHLYCLKLSYTLVEGQRLMMRVEGPYSRLETLVEGLRPLLKVREPCWRLESLFERAFC